MSTNNLNFGCAYNAHAVEIYYASFLEKIIGNSPWILCEMLQAVNKKIDMPILKKQVRENMYHAYDSCNMIDHYEVIFTGNKLIKRKIASPFEKINCIIRKNQQSMPDDFIYAEISNA
jgi:hypothetical protein